MVITVIIIIISPRIAANILGPQQLVLLFTGICDRWGQRSLPRLIPGQLGAGRLRCLRDHPNGSQRLVIGRH